MRLRLCEFLNFFVETARARASRLSRDRCSIAPPSSRDRAPQAGLGHPVTISWRAVHGPGKPVMRTARWRSGAGCGDLAEEVSSVGSPAPAPAFHPFLPLAGLLWITQGQVVEFFGKPSRHTRTTQNRWPVGARITTQFSKRFSIVAPSFSSRATSAGMSSASMSM